MQHYFFLNYQKKVIKYTFFFSEFLETETDIKYTHTHTMEKHQ
jgi:hypothetical protein